jgi:DNA (cytosine-5)-methyltransferase 1
MIKVGSDFSGVGAFNQALNRLGIEYKEIFACDMDKYARQTFIHNYGEPEYYPTNVYEREIPTESLDIYMTSPPCQAFSLAGKRLGKNDKRGILFFNSLEFIEKNKPRFFIFENVKGLLSDNGGRTFSEWVNFLGGKSVNGAPVLFPYADSVAYHLYWKVLNAKHHGVPQNRERVFLIGIRDDKDNNFSFPGDERLTKRLKDVLESEVDEKYFLSDEKINQISKWKSFKNPLECNLYTKKSNLMSCLTARGDGNEHSGMKLLKVKSATSKGYEEATEGDSINFSVPNSETRRGRVGKGVAQTLDTSCNKGVILGYTRDSKGKVVSRNFWENAGTIHMSSGGGGNTDQFVLQHNYKIRRLTPRECFRLMDFPDSFTWPVSDSQAYKQAGNSIVVNVLYKILKNLSL